MEQIYQKLKEHGIDTDGVTERLGGNYRLYLTICEKFVYDKSYPSLKEALSSDDLTAAGTHLHTLKGVAANLGFLILHELCNCLLEDLKQNRLDRFNLDIQKLCLECDQIISILSMT